MLQLNYQHSSWSTTGSQALCPVCHAAAAPTCMQERGLKASCHFYRNEAVPTGDIGGPPYGELLLLCASFSAQCTHTAWAHKSQQWQASTDANMALHIRAKPRSVLPCILRFEVRLCSQLVLSPTGSGCPVDAGDVVLLLYVWLQACCRAAWLVCCGHHPGKAACHRQQGEGQDLQNERGLVGLLTS